MTHSDFEPTPAIREHLAVGYDSVYPNRLDSETPEKEHAVRGYKVPNGALYTTIGDLARFEVFEMLGGPESVLPKQELEETRRQIFANADLTAGYGLGFQVNRVGEHMFIGHPGSVSGYMAMAYVQPQAGIGIVILRNENVPGAEKLLDLFMHKLEVK